MSWIKSLLSLLNLKLIKASVDMEKNLDLDNFHEAHGIS